MIDYKKMYTTLCGAVSDSLDMLSESAETTAAAYFLLKEALLQAEDMYLATAEDEGL